MSVEVTAIPGVPDIRPGDDLANILGDCLQEACGVRDGDILCLAHKIVSKAEGNVVDLTTIAPSKQAINLAADLNKDPAKVEVILGQSDRVVKSWRRPGQAEGTLICQHRLGFTSANAGVDQSNAEGDNTVITLPDDPDASAAALGRALEARFAVRLGLVITDTFGRPWRLGLVNVAIGLYQVPAKVSEIGQLDAWGRPLSVTEPALSDELAAASGLVVTKSGKTPLVLFRGVNWTPDAGARAHHIVRAKQEDMFQ
ncbi:MAG: coenzyme F420-0:L-glutamate ligase [Pseudomonadota bacterium]